MRGVILAAGRGSRMGARTREQPKCLINFRGRPLIDWQMDAMRQAGVDEIAIVTGYRSHMLRGLADREFHNPEWEHTQMVSSLARAAEWLAGGPCLVSYSDIVYSPDALKALSAARRPLAITYDPDWLKQWSARFDDPLSDAETLRVSPRGLIMEIGGRPSSLAEIDGQYMGLLRFTPEGWAALDGIWSAAGPGDRGSLDMTSAIQRLVTVGFSVQAIPTAGWWFEFDSENDLNAASTNT